ncbi:MAG: J domain-containing protein [Deltaproteobacteria bacterium]|nr:J domain-containing protein [Deltaproteobacteria bacterium]
MLIASRLRDTTLGDILAQLHRDGASGVLELLEPKARHAIHLRRGYVHAIESESSAQRLGDVAARRWGLGRPAIERARFVAHTRGIRIGQALVATEAIAPGQLDALLAEQQRVRLEALYAIPDAEIRFRVARPLPLGAAEHVPLPARETFFGRPRKRPLAHDPRKAQSTRSARSPHVSHTMSRVSPEIRNAYAALGVAITCDRVALRHAYRTRVLALHPDRAMSLPEDERNRRSRELITVLQAWRVIEAHRAESPLRAATG